MNEAAALLEAKTRDKFDILVIYNGIEKGIEVTRSETIKSVLERSIRAFGSLPNPHTLSLFTAAGQELDDTKTVESAGLKPHERLLLRPSHVKGG
jgi:hypothetical protein